MKNDDGEEEEEGGWRWEVRTAESCEAISASVVMMDDTSLDRV